MTGPRRQLSDEALLDLVQAQTLKYFWDFGHPASGLARERSNPATSYDYKETVTTGGSGFGIMALLAGVERGFLARAEVLERIRAMVDFLLRADRYHGVFPHFLEGSSGRTMPFSPKDDGGDLVETSFLVMGLLSARGFFAGAAAAEASLRRAIDKIWHGVEWDWHLRDGDDALYWHWSPRHGWAMNHRITGWNECLVTYVLAAASPSHPVGAQSYLRGWSDSPAFRNGAEYHGIRLPLGPELGGPLFFAHYSFMGLDPRGLSDAFCDYWQQNLSHTLINRAHCLANPHGHRGYGADCWGLTACDGDRGYGAFNPTDDRGVIAPTAALSSMPYTPRFSQAVLRHLYEERGAELWRPYGFADAFNDSAGWVADGHLAINQGPIVVMIENHRSGLLWRLFMAAPEVRRGLGRLGFSTPYLGSA